MNNINIWAILLAAAFAFVLGGIWYSPMLFGGIWKKAEGKSTGDCQKSHSAKTFALFFLVAIIAAFAFRFLFDPVNWLDGLETGLFVGIFFITTSFAINYMFANRGMKLFLIDAGYHLVQFAAYGLIIGAWH
jgi:hypothetical protein